MSDDLPPDPDLPTYERAVIGACLMDGPACTLALVHLQPRHFADHSAQRAFLAIQRNAPEGGHPDIVVVVEELLQDASANGAAKWAAASMEAVGSTAAQPKYVAGVLRQWVERESARPAATALVDEIEAVRLKLTKPLQIDDAPAARAFQPVGAFDLLQTTLPMIEELVAPRILYRGGVTVLVASHKRGKSLAALGLCSDLVVNIATPLEQRFGDTCPKWLGQDVVGAGPVLVYSAEGGPRMIQDRLRKMIPSAGPWLNDLQVYAEKPTPRLDDPKHLQAVFEHAEAMGAVLLVFDPLGRFWAMEDEGDPTAARNLMEAIQIHAEAAYGGRGIAVLVIHHDTKATGGDADSAVTGGRGSGKFGDDADALINLKIGGKGAPAGQSKAMFLLRHAESPAPVTVQIDPKTLRVRQATEEEKVVKKAATGGAVRKLSLENLEKCVRSLKRVGIKHLPGLLDVATGTWRNNRKELLRQLTENGDFHEDETTEEIALVIDGAPYPTPAIGYAGKRPKSLGKG